jgi:GTP cyclohydrolase I
MLNPIDTSTDKRVLAADLLSNDIDADRVQAATIELLHAIGEDVQRPGLQGTPRRVGDMYVELLGGYRTDPVRLVNDAIFEVNYQEMVLVKNIEFYSLCEHHLLPFLGKAHVAYIPNGKVIGLSKIPRIVDLFAHRLQLQEQLTRQIADFLEAVIAPRGVAVVLEGIHMCSMLRGVKKNDSRMITSAMTGLFLENSLTRNEFLTHINRNSENLI